MAQDWSDYIIIAVYMVVIIGIGLLFSKKKETTENYLLGGRNMPYLAIGLSCMMSLFSSVSIVQIPGEIFNHGWTLFSLSMTIGLLLQIPYYLLFTKFYFKLGSYTPYEYLEYRYSPLIRGLVAFSAFYTQVMYLGMVLYTSSKIFEGAYGWPAWFTILFVGVIGIAYTVLGGMKAVVWTDVIQFFVSIIGLTVIITVLCMNVKGGAVGAVRYAFETGHVAPQYLEKSFYSLSPYVRLLFWLLLWNAIIGPLSGACSDQINVQRLLSTKNWQAGFKSQVISSVLGMIVSSMLCFIGFAVYAYYCQNPDSFISKHGGDMAFFHFIATKLPSPMPGIFMAAMLAAIMSTLDSGINSMATVWLKEIHAKFINRKLSPEHEVRVARMATFLVGVFAITFGLAINFSGRWLTQSATEVGTIFYILGSATLPAFLLAVLTKRANSRLIWAYTFFSLGEIVAKNIWYVLSRSSEQAWKANPAVGFGWAGKLDVVYFLIPLFVGILLCLPWLIPILRKSIYGKGFALLGMVALGSACSMGMWYFFSNTQISDIPQARSFTFFLPISFIAALIVVWFCPAQPRKKWQGLTLASLGEPIQERNESCNNKHPA